MNPTGQEGEYEGATYVEYEMLDSEGDMISLHEDNVIYVKRDGATLQPNTDHTLWFNKARETGVYIYEVQTNDGTIYEAMLQWIN